MKKVHLFLSLMVVILTYPLISINYWKLSAESNPLVTSHHSIIPRYIYFIIQKEHSVSPIF